MLSNSLSYNFYTKFNLRNSNRAVEDNAVNPNIFVLLSLVAYLSSYHEEAASALYELAEVLPVMKESR